MIYLKKMPLIKINEEKEEIKEIPSKPQDDTW